jgi:hypothetical protein
LLLLEAVQHSWPAEDEVSEISVQLAEDQIVVSNPLNSHSKDSYRKGTIYEELRLLESWLNRFSARDMRLSGATRVNKAWTAKIER